jgi:hypothetical protein
MSDRRDTSARGQALEFEIWSALIKQSQGALHVFLPLLDRGVDAVLHRLTDGRYIPIQVKGRDVLAGGRVALHVRASSLVDDDALLIGSFTGSIDGQLDLVVEERIFKRLASKSVTQGSEVYQASFGFHPNLSHWRPYLVPRAELARHFLGMSPSEALQQLDLDLLRPSERHTGWLGFLGEAEVVRRLAESPRLDLFRPFPDLEMVEVLSRDNMTGTFAGLQVKAGTVSKPWGEARIGVHKSTLSSAANTWLVGLAWHQEMSAFDAECLLIPAADIPKIGVESGPYLVINFHPQSPERTRLDPYRRRLAELDDLILEACSVGTPMSD